MATQWLKAGTKHCGDMGQRCDLHSGQNKAGRCKILLGCSESGITSLKLLVLFLGLSWPWVTEVWKNETTDKNSCK